MNTAFLLIGGNMGDRLHFLSEAEKGIAQNCGRIVQKSAVYETAAWGLQDQSAFLNRALQLETELTATDLLHGLLQIEEQLGRHRHVKYGPRIIDIDILLFNQQIIYTNELTVPHPELQNRRFALQCLADIAAQEMHPVLHKTVSELLQQCTDPLDVHKF